MAESSLLTDLQKYEYIQFVIPDISNVPRGKIVSGKFKEKLAKNGFETGNGKFSVTESVSVCLSVCLYMSVSVSPPPPSLSHTLAPPPHPHTAMFYYISAGPLYCFTHIQRVAAEKNHPTSNESCGICCLRVSLYMSCLLYTSPSPRDQLSSRMPSSA